ncbi:MAG TPA: D-aminoacyl-tRNA deacylase [Spirochaetia bacterium]|nr:D-aminoacyl-tRNA deacylase [Spirochaetia bacterium]
MIAVTQVVDQASVSIYDQPNVRSEISRGLIIFLGVSKTDSEKDVDKLVSKIIKLRVFADAEKKMNLDIQAERGEILLISQFTLLGDVKRGNRPDFFLAADKTLAIKLYQLFADKLTKEGLTIKTGFFAEHMKIETSLNGPITIILDSNKL